MGLLGCLLQSGCSVVGIGGGSSGRSLRAASRGDGPPIIDVPISSLRDAVPRVEPYHPYGTKDYVVKGRKYKVLKSAKGYVRKGYASWYGSKFHGRQTATQEIYNLYKMTAASTELPLPTYVEVTNLRNGKKVVVRVNDRGPFYGGRILDLSYAAAKKLDFVKEGVAPVKVVAIDPKIWRRNVKIEQLRHLPSPASDKTGYNQAISLQVGAFTNLTSAQTLLARVEKLVEHKVIIRYERNLYRVRIGPFSSPEEGHKLKQFLKSKGFDQVIFIK